MIVSEISGDYQAKANSLSFPEMSFAANFHEVATSKTPIEIKKHKNCADSFLTEIAS
jgi:hypothetical protein